MMKKETWGNRMHHKKQIAKFELAECSKFIIKLIDEIKLFHEKAEVAVLAFNRDSVRSLQKEVYGKCKNTEDVLVETIDRIQGLTTGFCIFFVPLESIPYSLQSNRFNVATSRAKLCTLIISDEKPLLRSILLLKIT